MNEWRKLPWIEIGIVVLAAVLRIAFLDIKPPHFDEGINGWFVDQMVSKGFYHYDPTNYHGPLHFYVLFLSQTLFGRNLWALRMPTVIASLLAVWALLRYREFFGPVTARVAALAMAVSPACVFYGRYSIHESWMMLFAIVLMWGVIGLWQKGERRFLFGAVLGLTGMILTKETYLVHLGCLLLAAGALFVWELIIPSRPTVLVSKARWTLRDLAVSTGVAVFAIIFFYSGTFLDWSGLRGLVETFGAWAHTGLEAAGHEKTAYQIGWVNYYWLYLFARYEWPALAGFLFCFVLLGPSDARLRLIAIYGAGVLLAYSIIPYKTPWCILSIIWPFFLLFGAAIAAIARRETVVAMLAAIVLLILSLTASIQLNFYHYTDEKEPYVYVQTYTDINRLTQPLLTLAKKDPRYYHVRGQIILDSYYPLPWILGDFTQIGYYSKDHLPAVLNGDFIVADKKRSGEIEPKLENAYYRRDFRLRDSQEECTVYFREAPFKELLKNETPIPRPAQ